ncbi:MAG: hypothetical protein AB7Q17_02905 [Phycisphaerae bacterium]
MSDSPQPPLSTPPKDAPRARSVDELVGESAFYTLLSALLFLYVGFYRPMIGVSGDALYDGSVAAFKWMGRIVGIGLLLVALLVYLRIPLAALAEALLSTLAAAGCLAIAAIWILHRDSDGYLVGIFGLLNSFVAWGAWKRLR